MFATSMTPEPVPMTLDALVDEVRDFIDRVQQPRLKESRWIERMRQAGEGLAARVSEFATSGDEGSSLASMPVLSKRLRALADELAERPNVQALRERCDSLSRSYEEFLLELREKQGARAAALARSRQLKPRNYARNLFHVSNGIIAVTLYHFVLSREAALAVLGVLFGIFAFFEITRRFSDRWNDFLVDKVFGAISRPSERYRINSATLYLVALIIITWLFPKTAVEAAILVLGFSDPIASLAGKRWGKRKLFRDKSYAGTSAFFLSAFAAVGVLLVLVEPGLGMGRIIGVSLAMAFVGAITELLSSRIDDNLSIPIACAALGALLI